MVFHLCSVIIFHLIFTRQHSPALVFGSVDQIAYFEEFLNSFNSAFIIINADPNVYLKYSLKIPVAHLSFNLSTLANTRVEIPLSNLREVLIVVTPIPKKKFALDRTISNFTNTLILLTFGQAKNPHKQFQINSNVYSIKFLIHFEKHDGNLKPHGATFLTLIGSRKGGAMQLCNENETISNCVVHLNLYVYQNVRTNFSTVLSNMLTEKYVESWEGFGGS